MRRKIAWPLNSAAGRWSGFGPYYAMFPVTFAKDMVERYSPVGGAVIDPFCGRGTTPFVAKASNRSSFGSDINPVGWLFASVKTDPYGDQVALVQRLKQVADSTQPEDWEPESEFQAWAWCPAVLAFLRAARRNLDWRHSRIDRTLMGFILVHLHAKLGGGISNQMRQSKAMAPEYSVKWWRDRAMRPPELDPITYFEARITWRYSHGIIQGPVSEILLGDSFNTLDNVALGQYDLLLTSPPYCGVTNYKYDNWIRLWLLGGPALPEWDTTERYAHSERYRDSMRGIFEKAVQALRADAAVCVRTDTRAFTLETTLSILIEMLPNHDFYLRQERPHRTQTALYGDKHLKPGETDILALSGDAEVMEGFLPLDCFEIEAAPE